MREPHYIGYDAEHERRRKEQLERMWNRNDEQIAEESYLRGELLKIEARRRERELKERQLQALLAAQLRQPAPTRRYPAGGGAFNRRPRASLPAPGGDADDESEVHVLDAEGRVDSANRRTGVTARGGGVTRKGILKKKNAGATGEGMKKKANNKATRHATPEGFDIESGGKILINACTAASTNTQNAALCGRLPSDGNHPYLLFSARACLKLKVFH